MIVYLETKAKFREDIDSNRIEEIIEDAMQTAGGGSVGKSESRSWKNSLPCMDRILQDEEIPHDTGVAIEFNIPNTGKRIDLILTGTRQDGQRTAVVVELKQWEEVEATQKDAVVSTYVGGREREVSHPSYQAWSYAMLISDFNESVQQDPIHLNPCAYLHNCSTDAVINAPHYALHTERAPAFLKDDAAKLRAFIKTHVKYGDQGETMFRIRDGRIRPSKGLADHLASLLRGKREFHMIDDQKVVYETALHLARSSSPTNKNVLIVNGGPGTGKSVVAVNLLVECVNQEMNTQYVTKNQAPRDVYASKLAGTLTKTRINNLFVGSAKFTDLEKSTFQALLVDEAHRLLLRSQYSKHGVNQIAEIIDASCFTVFFIDEAQRVHWKDIGSVEAIREQADAVDAKVTELALESQFRCNGSDGYLSWIDHTLQIRETANHTLEGSGYEFKVCGSAAELRDLIYRRNEESNKARMVAGYCWDWITQKKEPDGYDITFSEPEFAARWNLSKDGMLWIISPESVHEVGCIHTCQGLELDYVGVILGPDLLIRKGDVCTDATARSKMDSTIKGYKKEFKANPGKALQKADEIIKNTYRTLMTRGQKGCYVYSVDPETNAYLQEMSKGADAPRFPLDVGSESDPLNDFPFTILEPEEVATATNAVPIFDIKVAAGDFSLEQWLSEAQWIQLPEPFVAKEGYFVTQVVGESMNRRIPNGSWCLFRPPQAGSRNNKVVLVQTRDIQDPDTGGRYTIKIYSSTKQATPEGWQHSSITLRPDSTHPVYQTIHLDEDASNSLRVIGELIAPLVNLPS